MGDETLTTLISQIKMSAKSTEFEKLLVKMQPLVKKYIRKLYFMEKEDAAQELNLSLIESVYHIKKYDNEAMCLTYLKKSVINKYYALCKQHIKFAQLYDEFAEIPIDQPYIESFGIIELTTDIQGLLNSKNNNQKRIIQYIIIDELSDSEISYKMKLSRQYVNRIKKKLMEDVFNFPTGKYNEYY